MTKKRSALIFIVPLLLGIGTYAVVEGLPGPGTDAEVAAAQDAQAAWMRQRSLDLIAQRGWNGVRKPSDAPGSPMDLPMLAGGGASLIAALGLAIFAARRF